MGLFVCAKCNCVENTALGWWWSRHLMKLKLPFDMKEFESGKGLCSECLPLEAMYEDGSGLGQIGKGQWHGKFPKQTVQEFLEQDDETHYKLRNGALIYVGGSNHV